MGTTAEKLQNILDAKADIGAAITEKGGTVPPKLIDYGKAIRALPAGGSPADELWGSPADPEKVYAATRPATWMPMPEPAPLEIYLLVEIPAGGSSTIAISSGTTDPTWEVSVGHMIDGAYTPKNTWQVNRGDIWEQQLAAADYPEFAAGADYVQVLVRIKFLTDADDVKLKDYTSTSYNIDEIAADFGSKGRLTSCRNQGVLRYCRLKNMDPIPGGASYFRDCSSLIAVMSMQFGPGNKGASFNGAKNLKAIPDNIFSMAVSTVLAHSFGYIFKGCASITGLPFAHFANPSDSSEMFADCEALTRARGVKLFRNAGGAFRGCTSLQSVEEVSFDLPFSGASNSLKVDGPLDFTTSPMLQRLTFAPISVKFSDFYDIDIHGCSFSGAGLVECFGSLPDLPSIIEGSTPAKAISVYGNPGTADLTAADIAIATAKGWTVVTEEPATTAEEGS